jgi:flagellar hook-basal body complex protein FliE
MNIAALASSSMQNLMNNQLQTFQTNAQSNLLGNLNNQTSNSNNSFQNVLNDQMASTQSSTTDISGIQATDQSNSSNLFTDTVNNMTQADSTFQADIVKNAQGELDNPHTLLIDSEKANIALQMAVSLRNKALEGYNDIIRMQV